MFLLVINVLPVEAYKVYSYDENGVININGYQQETRRHLVAEKLPLQDDMSWLYEKPKGKIAMNIILAIDISGSMAGKPLKNASSAAIEFVNGEYTINPETCIGCAICAEYCPVEAISEVE